MLSSITDLKKKHREISPLVRCPTEIHLRVDMFIFWGTATSLVYSKELHCIGSAFASRISILVDKTSYLHLAGIICQDKHAL